MKHTRTHRGTTMIGLLVTFAIIAILAAIIMSSMKGAVGGGGNTAVQKNQPTTHVDRENMRNIFQGMMTFAISNNSRLPSPTLIANSRDKSIDTSANFWSAMIAEGLCRPQQLISQNEQSDVVWLDDDYNATSNPTAGLPWDTSFAANIDNSTGKGYSNVSFAHEVLMGERFSRNWKAPSNSSYPILSNRGPKDGVPSTDSFTTGPGGSWAGNVVYADGSTHFVATTMPDGSDNLFAVDGPFDGMDAILGFTSTISERGFDLIWD
ncbi:MAG: hypothetical protein ACR2GY_04575 [Phycisphaerales bacterium]